MPYRLFVILIGIGIQYKKVLVTNNNKNIKTLKILLTTISVSPVGNTNWLLQRAMTTTLLASDIIILMNNTLRCVFGMYRSKLY